MPALSQRMRGKVLAALPVTGITTEALEQAIEENAGEDPRTLKKYISKLEKLGDIKRVAGGWQLSPASRKTHTIKIKISPPQATSDVRKAITAALLPFGSIATMEEEA